MKMIKNKTFATLIALILMLTIAIPLFALQTANALIKVEGFISVGPRISELGKGVLVSGWISPHPEITRKAYENLTVIFTKPDGTTDTKSGITTELSPAGYAGTGSFWFTYTPNALGAWSVKLKWAGDSTHEGTETQSYTFTVQEEPVPTKPIVPLPDYDWSHPIYAENREWYTISGDWYYSGKVQNYNSSGTAFNPYSKAPETAHVLWTHQPLIGGIVGGASGDAHYQPIYIPTPWTTIMGGRVYYCMRDGIHCLDARTGEELWDPPVTIPGTTPGGTTMAYVTTLWGIPDPQTYTNRDSPQPGTNPVLITVTGQAITKYDATTGAVLKTWTPFNSTEYQVTAFGATHFDLEEHVAYTQLSVRYHNGTTGARLYKWDTIGTVRDMVNPGGWMGSRLIWDVIYQPTWSSFLGLWGDVLVFVNAWGQPPARAIGVSAATGQQLWVYESNDFVFNMAGSIAYGKLFYPDSVERKIRAIDLQTGQQAWESDPADFPWGSFWAYNMGSAYDKVYAQCYDGHLYAYDVNTGKTVWKFYSGDTPDTPYGTFPWWSGIAIADGKVYAGTGEHSPSAPMVRGFRMYCLDADTGDEIWSISFSNGGGKAIAYGTLVAGNEYDQTMYAFNKGPSATTVTANPKVSVHGSSVLIEGTVTDQSPAQPGTPAVADEYMSAWMEYLHMQMPRPMNVTGVEVTLDAIDSNGNYRNIGNTTSDSSGAFSYQWTPDISGKYTVIATFAGSGAYWPSYSETSFAVDPAAPTAAPYPTVNLPPTETYFAISTVAIIIAIAIVGIMLMRVLRKRP